MSSLRVTQGLVQVLDALTGDPSTDWWGLEIAAACGLPATTVYGILARLEDERFVDTVWRLGIAPFKERVYANTGERERRRA